MKKGKLEVNGGGRLRFIHILLGFAGMYMLFLSLEFTELFRPSSFISRNEGTKSLDDLIREGFGDWENELGEHEKVLFKSAYKDTFHKSVDDSQNAPQRPQKESFRVLQATGLESKNVIKAEYGRISGAILDHMNKTKGMSELQRMANDAWVIGLKAWKEAEATVLQGNQSIGDKGGELVEICPQSISLSGDEVEKSLRLMFLPCGLTLGSSITLIGKPRPAHNENSLSTLVSQFMLELQGLKTVDGEEPPRILHFNPRLKGDWSGRPVIEQNTCYRMQWGTAQRCEGWRSREEEDAVDGFVKCEKWIRDDDEGPKESKTTWWLNRFIGREMKPAMDWPFPFVENRLFVLTLRAGLEGYHMNVDGRHVTSFPYRTNARKEVNLQLKKEADYYGDMIIVPFMDRYELVVLKTVAICEYGVQNLSAKYIMKCDDDTFVRVDTILKEIKLTPHKHGLYMGNLNLFHKPLRMGKWAVTYEEWPEEDYPTYANGPGYIISNDIANFVASQHANQSLRLFKMEDVSMGMWVEQFNASSQVQYSHNWKFCQYGCTDDYYTAHYQSPRQMLCMWDKLLKGKVECCSL
ncbi:hydroxyproline O-galactosyltransferase GALT2 isoform X2 [Cryptomeria japonica]|uniref:hydroxyproline O-galactosyltransferase GALT2 isoform X2 n=1 Tax=Cryptomeria japonica TaxID=3369 RepID=UPI0027DA6D1E|nr:hydroxyproline O-galactosyltransferase GALT2 isoform X2 [Cryptomeria japonica]